MSSESQRMGSPGRCRVVQPSDGSPWRSIGGRTTFRVEDAGLLSVLWLGREAPSAVVQRHADVAVEEWHGPRE
jgi:hypothetical protein